MNSRENLLRAVRFETPERIPVSFHVSGACWNHYPQDALQELMAAHPLLFPDFERSTEPVRPEFAPWQRAGAPYTDGWGCVWETAEDGITGTVRGHPLESWDDFEGFTPPSAERRDGWGGVDWEETARSFESARSRGGLLRGGLRHGHTFMTLAYIRGYENLIYDMADEETRLHRLAEMVEDFNASFVRRYLDRGAELMGYPEDLGMQAGPMLSPDHFRKYIKPSYRRLMAPAKRAGCAVHMHSDGRLRELIDDLLDCGIDSLNLQDLVNGVDWIAGRLKGRVCIDLDIDRQRITRFGEPKAIGAHIRGCVEKLGAPEGGLSMIFGLYPGTPIENVAAVMDAMERYSGHFA